MMLDLGELIERGQYLGESLAKSRAMPTPGRPLHASMYNDRSSNEAEVTACTPTTYERRRDALLKFLSSPVWNWLGILVTLGIVIDGAFFFMILVGMLEIRPEATKNWWYNVSLQLLCGFFSYSHLITLPWRLANIEHLASARRSSATGVDFYGLPSASIWFHIPPGARKVILILLMEAAITQYINQAMRLVFYSYERSETPLGVLMVNLFFGLSFLGGISGGIYQARQESRLRKARPDLFSASAVEVAAGVYRDWRAGTLDQNEFVTRVRTKTRGISLAALSSVRGRCRAASHQVPTAESSLELLPGHPDSEVGGATAPLGGTERGARSGASTNTKVVLCHSNHI
jgi:hypothetical protein